MPIPTRINSACRYIERHLDAPLALETLAREACLSKYHFHRLFRLATGETVSVYVQRLRLKRAALQLAHLPDASILDIALDANFGSAEAFARRFRALCGQSPSEFRRAPDWTRWHAAFAGPMDAAPNSLPDTADTAEMGQDPAPTIPGDTAIMDIQIIDLPDIRVATLAHRGPPAGLARSIDTFRNWRRESGLCPLDRSRTFGIAYGDPASVPPDEFRQDICASIDDDAHIAPNAQGVMEGAIPGGRYAVACQQGRPYDLGGTIDAIYRDWLPASGETLRDSPCVFEFLNVGPGVRDEELLTNVYVPLA